jgi:hypothetical protein
MPFINLLSIVSFHVHFDLFHNKGRKHQHLFAYRLLHLIFMLLKSTHHPIEILHINQMIYNQYCKNVQ